MKGMDEAAIIAEKELNSLSPKVVKVIGGWVNKHYLKAGYKRLGRLLVQKGKE